MQNLRNSKGFTLIELMIVVVIIGILAAIAIPKFSSLGDDAKVREADTQLKQVATLQDAFRAKCGTYTTGLTGAAATDCDGLDEVGYEEAQLQYYQAPTVTAASDSTFTVQIAPDATTGNGLPTRQYDAATGKITDL